MLSFKPYYNWNTFNTNSEECTITLECRVLNLIITGIPSILSMQEYMQKVNQSFKPYYNWNTFNTENAKLVNALPTEVLNLIITGIPSILQA